MTRVYYYWLGGGGRGEGGSTSQSYDKILPSLGESGGMPPHPPENLPLGLRFRPILTKISINT